MSDEYRAFIKSLDAEEKLYSLFGRLNDEFFRLQPEGMIRNYFASLGLPYEKPEDLDALSALLAQEIDRRRNDQRASMVLQMHHGRRSLEQLLGGSLKNWDAPLQRLAELPLYQVLLGLYDVFMKQPEGTVYLEVPQKLPSKDAIFDALLSPASTLFYSRRKKSVSFGQCQPGDKDCWDFSKYTWFHGFDVLMHPTRTRQPQEVIRIPRNRLSLTHFFTGSGSKGDSYKFTSPQFLTMVVSEFKKERYNGLHYLKAMLQLPSVFKRLMEEKRMTLEKEVGEAERLAREAGDEITES